MNRAAVGIYQQRSPGIVPVLGKACEMYFSDCVDRKGINIFAGDPVVIGATDVNIVDVQQQTAAGAGDERLEEIDLLHRAGSEFDIGRRILDQDCASERVLRLRYMI
jgi:hypothetical protein